MTLSTPMITSSYRETTLTHQSATENQPSATRTAPSKRTRTIKTTSAGPFGIDHVTVPAGMEFTHLLKAKNLVSTTTFFEHIRYTTWRNFQRTNEERAANIEDPLLSDPQIPFQLDHFLTQKQNLKRVLDAKQVGDRAPSDHTAIKQVLRIATRLVRKKSRFNTRPEKKKTGKKLDWRLLKNKEIRLKYNEALRTILEKEADGNGNAEVQYTNFMNATLQAAEDTIQGNGRISKDWFKHSEPELLKAISLRNYWSNVWTHTSMPEARQKFREARSNLKRSITVAKNAWHEKRAEELHNMKFDPKTAWLAI
eukprot:scaffold407965_cov39-Attheya_sp.AAC.1